LLFIYSFVYSLIVILAFTRCALLRRPWTHRTGKCRTGIKRTTWGCTGMYTTVYVVPDKYDLNDIHRAGRIDTLSLRKSSSWSTVSKAADRSSNHWTMY